MIAHYFFFTRERSAKQCLAVWGLVEANAQPGWEADFAEKIAHQSMRPGWYPSPLQLATMRDLVARTVADARVDTCSF